MSNLPSGGDGAARSSGHSPYRIGKETATVTNSKRQSQPGRAPVRLTRGVLSTS